MNTPEKFSTNEQVKAALATVLTSWPLYREFSYHDTSNTIFLPKVIAMYCDNKLCGKDTLWETGIYGGTVHQDAWKSATYKCRNCDTAQVTYHFHWYKTQDSFNFVKFGQWPALERRISPELKKHLGGEDYALYQKALRCRSQNLGAGALAYMRRVVENRTNELLEMIAAEAKRSGQTVELTEIEQAKKSYKFSDKIELAKKIIPGTLRPGNHNPIDQLHDIASEGLHWKTDEECSAIFDKARGVFEFLFQEMERRRKAAEEFEKTLTEIATRNG